MRQRTEGTTEDTDTAVHREFRTNRPLSSWLSTTREVLLSPQRFFDELPPDGPLGAPVLYFLLCTAITTVISLAIGLAFLAVPVVVALVTDPAGARVLITILMVFVFAFLVALPILLVAVFFVSVLILHALIRLLARRSQQGLSATVRVSCYSVGAPTAVAWIPLVGLLTVFYCFYLQTTGLKRAHGISTSSSVVAIMMVAVLLLILAAAVLLYDYHLIQETVGDADLFAGR